MSKWVPLTSVVDGAELGVRCSSTISSPPLSVRLLRWVFSSDSQAYGSIDGFVSQLGGRELQRWQLGHVGSEILCL